MTELPTLQTMPSLLAQAELRGPVQGGVMDLLTNTGVLSAIAGVAILVFFALVAEVGGNVEFVFVEKRQLTLA